MPAVRRDARWAITRMPPNLPEWRSSAGWVLIGRTGAISLNSGQFENINSITATANLRKLNGDAHY
ncbi:MAG: hypothetical protein KGN33_09915 [Paracoccaceae bacterium]|nr:hypothetical protein [Paracoccaceae bacterium]